MNFEYFICEEFQTHMFVRCYICDEFVTCDFWCVQGKYGSRMFHIAFAAHVVSGHFKREAFKTHVVSGHFICEGFKTYVVPGHFICEALGHICLSDVSDVMHSRSNCGSRMFYM